ncbi:MAG: hypothetical protein AAFR47_02270 [Pseudomonadota bacterium]
MAGLETLALAATLASTAVAAGGTILSGVQANSAAQAQASEAERQADEQRAVAQREAINRRREADLVLSRQQAVGAASGVSATDKTMLDLAADVQREGDFQVASALYGGESRGRALEYQAGIDRARGRQARLSSFVSAGGTVLQGAGYGASQYMNLTRGQRFSVGGVRGAGGLTYG